MNSEQQQQRIMGYFIEEAREHLQTIEQGVLNLHNILDEPESINELFRAAHSIKGGAAMLGVGSVYLRPPMNNQLRTGTIQGNPTV